MDKATRQLEIKKKVNNWPHIIQDCLLPPSCLLCNAPGFASMDLCADCYAELPGLGSCCPSCATPLDFDTPGLCGQCLSKPPAFDACFVPFQYSDVARHLILEFKYGKRYQISRLLATLLTEHLLRSAPKPDCIVPVPLHPKRYRSRSFNQSHEIARLLGKQFKLPVDIRHCKRVKYTEKQTGLNAKNRRANMRNAFSISPDFHPEHIALVDDVITTGATCSEVAKALKRKGVQRVDVWALAKAIHDHGR